MGVGCESIVGLVGRNSGHSKIVVLGQYFGRVHLRARLGSGFKTQELVYGSRQIRRAVDRCE
jgi:hypothetical protein